MEVEVEVEVEVEAVVDPGVEAAAAEVEANNPDAPGFRVRP